MVHVVVTDSGRRRRQTTQMVGVALTLAGTAVAVWIAWTLWLTDLSTSRMQDDLRAQWAAQASTAPAVAGTRHVLDSTPVTGPVTTAAAPRSMTVMPPPGAAPVTERGSRVEPGAPYAIVRFSRPGASPLPVHDDELYVVEGVGTDELRAGPGHYPHSAAPGGDGNFAVAGHRTTYGAPFGRLDELEIGDRVHVTDRAGEQWTYGVVERRIVGPGASWTLGSDPLGTGSPTMTLTTCHPEWTATQRMVVFAELVTEPSGDTG